MNPIAEARWRWPVFLSAAVAAVLAVVVGAGLASASAAPAAGARVGASHPQTILTVGVSQPVSAGEGRCRPVPQAGVVSGLCIDAEGANTGDVSVYSSVNAAGEVNYVRITNNVARRAAEQLASKGIRINPIEGLSNLSRADAHAVEQVLIEQNGGPGGQLLNKINSISPRNPIYGSAVQRGNEILSGLDDQLPHGAC